MKRQLERRLKTADDFQRLKTFIKKATVVNSKEEVILDYKAEQN